MKAFTILALATVSLAGKACRNCLTKSDVTELTEAYARLIGSFDDADLDYLTDDWEDYSQSINAFILPDDLVYADPIARTFDKNGFADAQRQVPDGSNTPIKIVGEPLVACNRFALTWTSTFGPNQRIVRGITIIEGKHRKGKTPVMTKWDVEFNSLIWATNTGGSYCLNLPSAEGAPPRMEGNPQCVASASDSKRSLLQ